MDVETMIRRGMVETAPLFRSEAAGTMTCVACSDSKRFNKGKMWLGKDKFGSDIWIDCPACGGKGEVPRLKHIDVKTGREIDYEAYGRI